MPNITKDTPTKPIQINGVILEAPVPYDEGHPLTKNEAAALNQTYLENVGNNFRGKVEAALRHMIAARSLPDGTEPSVEQIKAVSKQDLADFRKALGEDGGQALVDTKELQAGMNKLVEAYEFGVRRTSSVEVVDPVTKEARAVAKTALTNNLRNRKVKLSTVSKEWYAQSIDAVLDKEGHDPVQAAQIWKIAARRVKAASEVASLALDKVNLAGMSKDEPADEALVGDAPAA